MGREVMSKSEERIIGAMFGVAGVLALIAMILLILAVVGCTPLPAEPEPREYPIFIWKDGIASWGTTTVDPATIDGMVLVEPNEWPDPNDWSE